MMTGRSHPIVLRSPRLPYNEAVKCSISIALLSVIILGRPVLRAAANEQAVVDFARDVRPILARSCGKCHGEEKQKGGLRFDRRKEALGASDSGKKAIVPGKA